MISTTVPPVACASGSNADLLSPVSRVYDDRPFRGDGDLLALAFAPDGSLRAVEEPGVLRHWNTAGGRQLAWHFLCELEMLWAFSEDARWLASASDEVSLWDAATGKLWIVLPQPCWVTAVAFSRNSSLVATGHDDGVVRVWDVADKRMVCECGGHKGSISAVAFNADGTRLASAGEKKIIRIFDVPSGVPHGTLIGHTDRIPALAWHPNGQRLYSAGWDTTVRVWDVTKCEPIILLNSHATQVTAMALNRDGTLLASGDSDRRLHLWDTSHHRTLHIFTDIDSEIRSLGFSPDGNQLASGGTDRVVHVWSREGDQREWRLVGGEARAASFEARTDLALSLDGNRLVSTGAPGLRVWDTATAQTVFQPDDGHMASAVALSPADRWMAGGGADGRIRLWDLTTGRQQAVLEGQHVPLTTLAVAPDGTMLAAGGSTGTDVWLWDVAQREPALVIPDAVDGRSVETLAFARYDRLLAVGGIDWLATGGGDGIVTVWDLEKRTPKCTFAGGALRLAFHPSRPWLAAASLAHSVRVWDLTSKRLAYELTGGDETVTCVAFSADGRWLAAGDDDHVLRLWDADGAALRGVLELDSQIKALAFSQDGRYLYTANGNSSCYQIEVQRLLDAGV